MGRSLSKLPGAAVIESFEKAELTHAATGLIYRAYRDADGRYWQEERHPSHASVRRIEATHIIGSGNHTRSYLGKIDNELVQLPLTWYAKRKIWDFSPGYEGARMPRFGRRVEAPCLFCHNGLTPLVEGRTATYQWPLVEGIGCDRCHGDGAAHVEARMAGKGPAAGQPDPSIFNPKRHSPQRQLQVCQQCHLQADASVVHAGHTWDAYDPRLPLDAYLSVFRKAGDDGDTFSIASHGRRLAQSQCAQKSPGKLGCTTCHNPHKTATDATYRAACLSCHTPAQTPGQTACSDPGGKTPDAQCHRCHMRAGETSDVPHVEFTDHYIRKRPKPATSKGVRGLALEEMVAGAAAPDAWLLGMGHTHLWERMSQPEHLPEAVKVLKLAVQQSPRDVRALKALGRALARQKQGAQAEALFKRAADAGATDEEFMLARAQNALDGRQLPLAKALFEAAAQRYPSGRALLGLAQVQGRTGDVVNAAKSLEAASKFTEVEAKVKAQQAAMAIRRRDSKTARALLDAARKADPLHLPTLIWDATWQMDQKRPQAALALLDQVIQRDPNALPAYALRGQVWLGLKQPKKALADFERLVQLNPNAPGPRIMVVQGLMAMGQKEKAQKVLADALAQFPGDAKLLNLAKALR
jgi:tetratricopeptide (TPR) repeat protein